MSHRRLVLRCRPRLQQTTTPSDLVWRELGFGTEEERWRQKSMECLCLTFTRRRRVFGLLAARGRIPAAIAGHVEPAGRVTIRQCQRRRRRS
jgi:hypothetical protein